MDVDGVVGSMAARRVERRPGDHAGVIVLNHEDVGRAEHGSKVGGPLLAPRDAGRVVRPGLQDRHRRVRRKGGGEGIDLKAVFI